MWCPLIQKLNEPQHPKIHLHVEIEKPVSKKNLLSVAEHLHRNIKMSFLVTYFDNHLAVKAITLININTIVQMYFHQV